MEIICGRLRELSTTAAGEITGFVIDGGMEVHLLPAYSKVLAPILFISARLEICGVLRSGTAGDPHLEARFITNLDLKQSAHLQSLPPPAGIRNAVSKSRLLG